MKILQIFSKYREYGGEEAVFEALSKKLSSIIDITDYTVSTDEVIARPLGKLQMPFLMQRNMRVLEDLRLLQSEHSFDFWQIHNVFPVISVAVYELAKELNVPVVQYLHNYRFGCCAATYFRDGSICRECTPMSMSAGVKYGCWRGSRMASAVMAAAIRRFWSKGSAEYVKVYLAISEAQKREHVAMGIPVEKIHVLPHFLEEDSGGASTINLGKDVLYMGRLTKEKGVHLLLEAWSRIDTSGRKLLIAGTGPDEQRLQELVLRERMRNVVFLGFVPKEKHEELWRQVAFFVVPSIWLEPFGMVVLEAWRHRLPVLATNHGSFSDLIAHGKDGWLAEPDVVGLVETLQLALDSESNYRVMGDAGHQKLNTHYGADRWYVKWSKIIHEKVL